MIEKLNHILNVGNKYSKNDLSKILKESSLAKVREGIYYCKNSPDSLLFCDLEKQGKEKRFHFNDFFVGEMLCTSLIYQ